MSFIDMKDYENKLNYSIKIKRIASMNSFIEFCNYLFSDYGSLLFVDNYITRGFVFFLIFGRFKRICIENLDDNSTFDFMEEVIKSSSYYRQLECEYDNYISSVADFINSFNFQDSIEITLFLVLLLKKGCFSCEFNHKYRSFKYDTGFFTDMLGARVLTGECVCRHNTFFVTDVLNKLGVDSCNLGVRVDSKVKIFRGLKYYNHAVTGVMDNGKKYIVDSTGNKFGFKSKKYIDNLLVCDSIMNSDRRFIICKNQDVLNKKYKTISNDFINSEWHDVDKQLFKEKVKFVKKVFELNIDYINEFINQNYDRMLSISKLEGCLFPHGDEQIVDWIIK